MRLGIFGGSFDPVHYGHLLLAECCRTQCRLDRVLFVPAAVAPHKKQQHPTAADHRLEMLQLAIAGHEPFDVSRLEIDRGGVSYTVETLRQLKAEDASRELFLLIGADSLDDLPTWREPGEICALATIVVVARPDAAVPDFSTLKAKLPADQRAYVRGQTVVMPLIELSSSAIRDSVAHGASIRFQTPRAVEKYIETHGLYR